MIRFFRVSVPKGAAKLLAIPNGGFRNPIEGARLLEEGVEPGASDLVLILPGGRVVWCEVKTEADALRKIRRTTQSASQEAFQTEVEDLGHTYRVLRSLDELWRLLLEFGVPCRARPFMAVSHQQAG